MSLFQGVHKKQVKNVFFSVIFYLPYRKRCFLTHSKRMFRTYTRTFSFPKYENWSFTDWLCGRPASVFGTVHGTVFVFLHIFFHFQDSFSTKWQLQVPLFYASRDERRFIFTENGKLEYLKSNLGGAPCVSVPPRVYYGQTLISSVRRLSAY